MYQYSEDILLHINDYKKLLRVIKEHENNTFFEKEKEKFDILINNIESFFNSIED